MQRILRYSFQRYGSSRRCTVHSAPPQHRSLHSHPTYRNNISAQHSIGPRFNRSDLLYTPLRTFSIDKNSMKQDLKRQKDLLNRLENILESVMKTAEQSPKMSSKVDTSNEPQSDEPLDDILGVDEEVLPDRDIPEKYRKDYLELEAYITGTKGKKKDYLSAVHILEKLKEDIPQFNYTIGMFYLSGGPFLKRNLPKFKAYMEKVIDLNLDEYRPHAEVLLGRYYLDIGKEVEGIKLLQRTFERDNNPEAALTLGQHLMVKEKFTKARKFFDKAAESGVLSAITSIGWMTMQGLGVEANEAEGLEILLKAAGQGEELAQCMVGHWYFEKKDYEKALEYHTKAMNGERPESMHDLAVMYLEGLGVEEDQEKGFDLLCDSAEAGFPLAQLHLGLILTESPDEDAREEAFFLLKKAANAGLEEASEALLKLEGNKLKKTKKKRDKDSDEPNEEEEEEEE